MNVPDLLNVHENRSPGLRSWENNPSSLVTLCTVPSVSSLLHCTVEPTGMLTSCGLKLKFLIETLVVDACAGAAATNARVTSPATSDSTTAIAASRVRASGSRGRTTPPKELDMSELRFACSK